MPSFAPCPVSCRGCAQWLSGDSSGSACCCVPIVYLVAARMLLAARFPSTHALVDDWYNHAVYAPMFLLGFALAGTRAPWAAIERFRWHALGFAVLGWVFLCVYYGLDSDGAAADGRSSARQADRVQRADSGSRSWPRSASRAGI